MAVSANQVNMINISLVRAGCLPISANASIHPSGPAVFLLFDHVLNNLLSYQWTFARRVTKPAREDNIDTATNGAWLYRYPMPNDRLAPPRAVYDRPELKFPLASYQLYGEYIYCDAADIWVKDNYIPAPGFWPGYFGDLFTLALAAEYASAIREDWDLRARLMTEAFGPKEYYMQGGRAATAMTADGQTQPSEQVMGGYDPITAAMRSGG